MPGLIGKQLSDWYSTLIPADTFGVVYKTTIVAKGLQFIVVSRDEHPQCKADATPWIHLSDCISHMSQARPCGHIVMPTGCHRDLPVTLPRIHAAP